MIVTSNTLARTLHITIATVRYSLATMVNILNDVIVVKYLDDVTKISNR